MPRYSQKYPSPMDLAVSAFVLSFADCKLVYSQSTCSTTRSVWLEGLAWHKTVSVTRHELIIDTSACIQFASNSCNVTQPLHSLQAAARRPCHHNTKLGRCIQKTLSTVHHKPQQPEGSQSRNTQQRPAHNFTCVHPHRLRTSAWADSSMSHATCDHSAAAMCAKGRGVCTDSGWVATAAKPNQT